MQSNITEHIQLVNELDLKKIEELAIQIRQRIDNGKKVLICGNGGSAADSQHFAAELIGRFKKERYAMPAIALTTDSSIITAVANDYSFEEIFSRQLEGLLSVGDVVIGISTSGNSKNVVKALEFANDAHDVLTVSLTGQEPNKLQEVAKVNIAINSKNTARVQEMHILILHLLAEKIEE
jgi:D-sedoheptulose 7-phosphate isomerase